MKFFLYWGHGRLPSRLWKNLITCYFWPGLVALFFRLCVCVCVYAVYSMYTCSRLLVNYPGFKYKEDTETNIYFWLRHQNKERNGKVRKSCTDS